MTKKNYSRDVLAMDDVELEQFVLDWVNAKKMGYVEVKRFSGAGDLGRDVVGFLSKERHEGDWHNYQCKQYAKTLPTDTALCEIGKILYYAFQGEFSVPTRYFFVAPRGVNRNLEKLIFKPSEFKSKLTSEWDQYCADKIIDGTKITLEPTLRQFVEAFDFSTISCLSLDDILNDPAATPILYKWFKADPGEAPKGNTPQNISSSELPYINQLVSAYSQREAKIFSSHTDIASYPEHNEHLSRQRERFYHADAFKRFYRDNTDQTVIEDFESEILDGVVEKCNAKFNDALERVDAVMSQAAQVKPSGILESHARVAVRQGICHHFANEGKLKWQK